MVIKKLLLLGLAVSAVSLNIALASDAKEELSGSSAAVVADDSSAIDEQLAKAMLD